MPHAVTKLLKDYDISRHDIKDSSWAGLKKLMATAAAMFRHNYELYRQLQISGEMIHTIRGLIADWKRGQDLEPNGMIDELEALIDGFSDTKPAELLKDECHCPDGYTCPHCNEEDPGTEAQPDVDHPEV